MGLSADCAEKSRPRAEREQLRPQAKREPYGGFRDPDRYPSGMGEEPRGGPAWTWFRDPDLQRTGMGEEARLQNPDRHPSGMGEEPSGGPARTWFQDPALQRTGMGEESLSSLARTSTHRRHCGALAAMGQEGALAARRRRASGCRAVTNQEQGGTAKGITHIGGYAAHINPGGVRRHREGIKHIGAHAAHINPGGLQGAVAATGQEGGATSPRILAAVRARFFLP